MKAAIALAMGAALVAGCASGNRPTARQLDRIDRALEQAPGAAQPSIIVKTELALNRLAREKGQVDAYRKFAAPNAQVHSDDGIETIAQALAGETNPDEPSLLTTKSVFMSCDGSMAVSQGRGRDADGTVGNYVLVWERQRGIRPDGEEETGYRFTYFTAAADNPQPPPRKEPEVEPGGILVEAIDSIRADIGRCPEREARGERGPRSERGPRQDRVAGEQAAPRNISRDGTLRWSWENSDAGNRSVTVELMRKEGWETVLTQTLQQSLPFAPN